MAGESGARPQDESPRRGSGLAKRGREYARFALITSALAACWMGLLGHFVPGLQWSWLWQGMRTEHLVQSRWHELVEGPRLGSGSATVVVVEFADYECPACRQAYDMMTQSLSTAEKARIVYRNLPLESIHPFAREAALASICAERQGRFAEMHAILFDRDEWSREPDRGAEASLAGVDDTTSLVKCMRSRSAAADVGRDSSLAVAIGLTATPSFVTRSGSVISGVPSRRALLKLLGGDRDRR